MAFEIKWLESALKDLDAEIEYVYCEFGKIAAQKVYRKIIDQDSDNIPYHLSGLE